MTVKINRTLRYGGYATLVTAAVVTLLVGVNLAVQQIPWRADLTFERFFTLSEQTEQVLAALDRPVTVLELWEAGRENQQVAELIRTYESRSRHLRLRQVDPYRNPVELRPYEVQGQPPEVGSIILDTGGRFHILKVADLYEMKTDSDTGESVPGSFIGESALTNAIATVTEERDPVVYFLRGHGEKELPASLRDRLERAFYDLRELTLGTVTSVPEDATMVISVSPRQDLLPREVEPLRSYLRDDGGKMLLMTDLGADPQPNLGRLLEGFGLALRPWLVVERASEHMLPNQPFVLIPVVVPHVITDPNVRSDFPILFPVSQVLETLPTVRRTVSIEPLLTTSDGAYAKVRLDDASGDQAPGDPDGPFVLAAAVTDSGEMGEKPSRMVVMASSHFLFPAESLGRLEENENYFLNCLEWLQDRPALISIRPRTIVGDRYVLQLSQAQFMLFAAVAVVLIPALIFGAAFVTWLRRRHR